MAAPVPSAYYAPPPNQTPNIFAAFWSGFMQTRNPWATELFFQRLAENPQAERDALILEHLKLRGLDKAENGKQARAAAEAKTRRFSDLVKMYDIETRFVETQTRVAGGITEKKIGRDIAELGLQELSTEGAKNAVKEMMRGLEEVISDYNNADAVGNSDAMADAIEKAKNIARTTRTNLNDKNDRAIAVSDATDLINLSAGGGKDPISRAMTKQLGTPIPSRIPPERGAPRAQLPDFGSLREKLGGDLGGASSVGRRSSGTVPTTPRGEAPPAGESVPLPAPAGGAAPSGLPAPAPASGGLRRDDLIDELRARPLTSRLGDVGTPIRRRPTTVEAPGVEQPKTVDEAADLLSGLKALGEGESPREAAGFVEEQRAQVGLETKGKKRLGKAAEGLRGGRLLQPVPEDAPTPEGLETPDQPDSAEFALDELERGGTPEQVAAGEEMTPERRKELQAIIDRANAAGSLASGVDLEKVLLTPKKGTRREGRKLLKEAPEQSRKAIVSEQAAKPGSAKLAQEELDRGGTPAQVAAGEKMTSKRRKLLRDIIRGSEEPLNAADAAEDLVSNGMDDEEDDEEKKRRARGEIR